MDFSPVKKTNMKATLVLTLALVLLLVVALVQGSDSYTKKTDSYGPKKPDDLPKKFRKICKKRCFMEEDSWKVFEI